MTATSVINFKNLNLSYLSLLHSVHFSKSNEKDHRMSFAFRQKSDKKLGLIFYFKLLQQSLLKCNKWLMKQLLWHYISAKFFGNTFLYIFIK